MNTLPLPLFLLFGATTLAAIWAFSAAMAGRRFVWVGAVVWCLLQAGIASSGFYRVVNAFPPRLLLLAGLPPIALIVGLFVFANGQRFLNESSLKWCVLYHTVRIPVEIGLYVLFLHKAVSPLMTFEGGNVDVLVGLTAPLIWLAYDKRRVGANALVIWNALSLLSLFNAVGRALLSAPFPFQRLSLDQPTAAILYFPFNLLLAFIVPAALLCHLAVFRKLAAMNSAHPELGA